MGTLNMMLCFRHSTSKLRQFTLAWWTCLPRICQDGTKRTWSGRWSTVVLARQTSWCLRLASAAVWWAEFILTKEILMKYSRCCVNFCSNLIWPILLKCVETGLRAGINFIDTSPFYGDGKSEEVLGLALRRVPRHCYYIATKVGRYSSDWTKAFDFTQERVLREFDNSLARLQLSSVDILHVHDFEYCQSPEYIAKTTLPAVLKIVQSGRAKYIGITGYPLQEFQKVLDQTPVKVNVVLSYSRNVLVDMSLQVKDWW